MRPLVDPGPPLTAADAVRFARHTVLAPLGELGQRRLRNARVCVVGAGGLGSPALLYLAAAGVGTLGIVDRDDVDVTNLQRQVVHGAADVGRRKVASARDAVRAVDPGVRVREHDGDLTAATVRDVLAGYDLVLDGADNFPTRYLVNDACATLGLPLVWGSVLGFDAQVSVFWSAPPEGEGVDLRDLFPNPPDAGEVPSCAEAGVMGALCGQVGSLMVTEAIKLVTGIGRPLLGRVLTIDALAARTREVPLRRAAGRSNAAAPRGRGGRDADRGPSGAAAGARCDVSEGAAALPSVTPAELAARLARGDDVAVIDVREPHEHAAGAIPGARLVPLSVLRAGGGLAAIPGDRPVVLHCAVGARSAEALRVVRAAGHPDAAHLAGGIRAWWAYEAAAAPAAAATVSPL
jgi:adenylyltransferase/sulfurtransferase